MSGGKVVAWRVSNTGKHWELRKTEPRGWRYIQPLVLQSDLAAVIAERDKLRSLCACAYQMAGYHDAPVVWLDALGDAANGTPLSEWRVQADELGSVLLPYSPNTESAEAAIARAEAMERDAARYRWLRDNPRHEHYPYFDDSVGKWCCPYLVSSAGGHGGGVGLRFFDTLDAAIAAQQMEES